jgi:hypothetical protein
LVANFGHHEALIQLSAEKCGVCEEVERCQGRYVCGQAVNEVGECHDRNGTIKLSGVPETVLLALPENAATASFD